MGKQTLALLAALDSTCTSVEDLGQAAESFQQHRDYAIITSFSGLADSTGARVLADIGDDGGRFGDARALKAYAGSAPVTRADCRRQRLQSTNFPALLLQKPGLAAAASSSRQTSSMSRMRGA
jgi:hypothetical protein